MNRRIRVRGVVTARVNGTPVAMSDFTTSATFRYVVNVIYVKDGTARGAGSRRSSRSFVRPGDVVEAAGFPAVTPGRPILQERAAAGSRRRAARPPPVDVALAEDNVLTPDHDAEIVRMNGQLLSVLAGTTRAGAGAAIRRHHLQRRPRHRPGERQRSTGFARARLLSVTGVYSYQGGPPPSFRLFLRSPDDVKVLAPAHWWTMRHTAVMAVMLALVACGGALWMRAIANRKRQEYQAVLNERTRVGARAPRHRRTGARRDLAAARSRGRQFPDRAGRGAAVARRRAADAALQPGGDEALGDGSAVAGAGERVTWAARSRALRGR